MRNIIFVEGISGTGKSTAVKLLSEYLINMNYSVRCYMEGAPDGPLDLCRTAYLTKFEYKQLLDSYPDFADKLSKSVIITSLSSCGAPLYILMIIGTL